MPIAEKITEQVICLPMYPELNFEAVEKICSYIK
jgi:dTDP-4-amino-4,6-dideoxygalactose transaminase